MNWHIKNKIIKMAIYTLFIMEMTIINAQSQLLNTSKHDFTDGEGYDDWYLGGTSCYACHAPIASKDTISTPKWDASYERTAFPLYNADLLDIKSGEPGMMSVICMSCHDDTIANEKASDDDHPIGIIYDDILVYEGTNVNKRNSQLLNSPHTLPLPLYDERVECLTCHDIHTDQDFLLRISNTDSNLCLSCHFPEHLSEDTERRRASIH